MKKRSVKQKKKVPVKEPVAIAAGHGVGKSDTVAEQIKTGIQCMADAPLPLVIKLDFSLPGFFVFETQMPGQDVTSFVQMPVSEIVDIVGRNVLTQEEVDALVNQNNSLKAALDRGGDVIRDLQGQLDALTIAAGTAATGDTVIGVAHPVKAHDLPKLGDLPVHKALD